MFLRDSFLVNASCLFCGFLPGGKIFRTTFDTLTQREPESMLAAMFSGRHSMHPDADTVNDDLCDINFSRFSRLNLFKYIKVLY